MNNRNNQNIKRNDNFNINLYRSYNNNKKKNIIKPPFRQGLYSYSDTLNIFQKNTKTERHRNYNLSNSKNKYINNMNNIIIFKDGNKITKNNSSLCLSSINLNKYKIKPIINKKEKSSNFKNINKSNSNECNNSNNNNNINIVKDININKSINFNIINENKNKKDIQKQSHYKNYFAECSLSEIESRRMIIEYIKILDKKEKDVNKTLKDYNISKKVLNQKYYDNECNDNFELFGEAKKEIYLKNLNYSLSSELDISNNDEEENNSNKNINILNINNLTNLLFGKENKKINLLYFLCVPKILNLIGENDKKEKYIFLLIPDENIIIYPKESYIFQWRNPLTNEIENEFNIKSIKNCMAREKYNNRFIIEVEKEDIIDNLNFEIETPSKEVCNNYVNGINYLIEIK